MLLFLLCRRYWAVTQVDYIHTRNSQRIGIMIVLVWGVALVVSLAPQFGWKDPEYLHRINVQQRCLPSQDIGYQIFATCSTFYVPLLVILGLYWKIFQTARKRIHKRQALKNYVAQDSNKTKSAGVRLLSKKRFLRIRRCGSDSGAAPGSGDTLVSALVMVEGHSTTTVLDESTESATTENKGDRKKSEASEGSPPGKEATTAFTISGGGGGGAGADAANYLSPANVVNPQQQDSQEKNSANNGSVGGHRDGSSRAPSPEPGGKANPSTLAAAKKEKKETLEAKRERKAAKTLAIITGAFVVCWLPFFIMALVMPLCETCVINDHVSSLFLWLGYFNSTLNPVIYTVFSPEFRQAFKRILYGGRHPRNGRGQGRARDFRTGRA
ncbi:5-hydroxytryptamine receptor, partial [Frankliniella fusca]